MKIPGFLTQVGGWVSEGGQFSKQPVELAKKFKVALEQKQPSELANILEKVKAMGVKAENAFLKSALGGVTTVSGIAASLSGTVASSAAASLKDAVFANFSPEQRAELAKELFGKKAFALKARKDLLVSKSDLDTKLAKFLDSFGKQKLGVPSVKDEMLRGTISTLEPIGQGVVRDKVLPPEGQLVRDCRYRSEIPPELRRRVHDEWLNKNAQGISDPADVVALEELRQQETKGPRET